MNSRSKVLPVLIAGLLLGFQPESFAQGTAFTYQGRLINGGSPANGKYDMVFKLADSETDGNKVANAITNSSVAVSNGLFTVTLDFGSGTSSFNGQPRWLDIQVRTNGNGAFNQLSPRQSLTATPYSILAGSALNAGSAMTAASAYSAVTAEKATNLVGNVPDALLSSNIPRLAGTNTFTGTNYFSNVIVATNAANQIAGSFVGNGVGITNLSASSLLSGSITADKLAPGAISSLDAAGGGASDVLAVSTNGLVGIGTTSPSAGLEIVNGSVITVLSPIFGAQSGIYGYTNLAGVSQVAAMGNLVAMASVDTSSITLANIANPSWPVAQISNGTGPFTNLSGASSVAWSGSNLVVAAYSSSAVTVISMTNPAAPVKLAEIRDGVGVWNYLRGAYSVSASGNLVAVGAYYDSAVTLVDLANPSSPVLRGYMQNGFNSFTNLSGVFSVSLSSNLLAVASYDSSAVTLVNVSDPSTPKKLAEVSRSSAGFSNLMSPTSVSLCGNLLAIACETSSSVFLVNVSNPTSPVKLAELNNGKGGYSIAAPRSVALSSNYMAIASLSSSTVTLVDIRNPSSPVLLATAKDNIAGADFLWGALGVTFSGTNVIATAGYDAGFTIFGIGQKSASLETAGWVGIGTTYPRADLDVVGNVVIDNADFFNVSAKRISMGMSAMAPSLGSVALGASASAVGNYSQSLGAYSQARGGYSTSLGYQTIASGVYSTAIGDSTKANGAESLAMGFSAVANGFAAVSAGYYCVAGGRCSTASGQESVASGDYSIASGCQTTASGLYSTVGGGARNVASGAGSVVAGGGYDGSGMITNTASGPGSSILGGTQNISSGSRSTIGGGHNNSASGYYATVPGGAWNVAGGMGSFAAGQAARALHDGAFVWNCEPGYTLSSTANSQFITRASGGYSFYTGATGGATLAAGSGSWTSMSDRNSKENFVPVNTTEVLEKVTALPLTTWNYKQQDASIRHLGPMAQDFKAAFSVGETETGITGVDADGVALAAIQGLNKKVESENAQLRREVQELKELVLKLTAAQKEAQQ